MSKNSLDQDTTIDSLLEKVDPLQGALMVLGGTAAVCGMVPPMTQLLKAVNSQFTGTISTWDILTKPGYQLVGDWLNNLLNPSSQQSYTPLSDISHEDQVKMLGLFCSGAVEAAITWEFVHNPTTFTQLIKLPGEAMQGMGKLIP